MSSSSSSRRPQLHLLPTLALLMAAALALVAPVAHAWGKEGHNTVAKIAAQRLSPSTKAKVDAIISASSTYSSIEAASTWPDQARTPETAPLHYVDFEDAPLDKKCEGTTLPTDCDTPGCVVSAIAKYGQQLAANADKPQSTEARDALAFIIHFVGDITQPLHSSNFGRGGNEVKVKYNGKTAKLHGVWDTPIPVQTIKTKFGNSIDNYATALSKEQTDDAGSACVRAIPAGTLGTDKSARALKQCAEDWAKETHTMVCPNVYGPKFSTKDELSKAYYDANAPIVDQQIARGGQRLVAVLEAALGAGQ